MRYFFQINEAVIQSFEATNKMFKDYTFYSQRPFPNSYQLRSLIGNHLYDKILKDLDILKVRMENGEKRYEILNEMIAEDQFEEWFINFQLEADLLLK